MNTLRPNQIIIVIVGIIIIGIGVVSYLSSQDTEQGPASQNEEVETVDTVSGKITSIDTSDNSFVLFHSGDDREYTVKLSDETEMIRLSFPFDLADPPSGATFVPEEELITISDLREGDQLFLRSNSPVDANTRIVIPENIQVLP